MQTIYSSPSLDLLGALEGTNKGSLYQDYLRNYEPLLAPYRDLPINLIEIGVADGGSVRMWERWMPRAQIVGIDISPGCKSHERGRIAIEIGSQADHDFMAGVLEKFPPTIVIDDGSHIAGHIIASFEQIFPKLLPGGCYIIEDLYVHGGEGSKQWRGDAKITPPDYIAQLVPNTLTQRVERSAAGDPDKPADQVARIVCIAGAAMIFKKSPVPSWADRIAAMRLLAEQSGRSRTWLLLASNILRGNGPLDEAEKAARKAIELRATDPRGYQLLATVMGRQGRLTEAGQLLDGAIAAATTPAAAQFLRDLRAKLLAPGRPGPSS